MRKECEPQEGLSSDGDNTNNPPVSMIKHKTLEQRLTDFYGVNSEEVPCIQSEEVSWGKAKGNEL